MRAHDVMAEEVRQCRERVTKLGREPAIAQDGIKRTIDATASQKCHDNLGSSCCAC